MTETITVTARNGFTEIETLDRQMPPSEFFLCETPWRSLEHDGDRVLNIVIESEVARFTQSDIRRLIPYLECFARTGRLIEIKLCASTDAE
jgi:hypothetical protein